MIRTVLLVLAFSLALGAGLARLAITPPAVTTAASVAAFDLATVQSLGELRLVVSEISIYQRVDTLDPRRFLTVVIPVRLVLGLDLAKATVTRGAEDWQVALPAVRVLGRSSDTARWTVWSQQGALQTPEEQLSLAQLAELQAFAAADREAERLGLHALAAQRARSALAAWAGTTGAAVTFAP
jgi:hypothetical protein